jgi:hypothetical protein
MKYIDTISGEELYIDVDSYGSTYYFKDKKKTIQHRIDGPAVDKSWYKAWYANGEVHRIDGSAIEHSDGDKSWYINDVLIFGVDNNNRLVKRMK